MVLAAMILTVAFFVKHNLILLPLSLGAWLLLVDRRHAVTFIASGILFLLIGAGIFREVFGTGFFHQIASARVYALGNIWLVALAWLVWASVPIAGASFLFIIARRDQFAVLAVTYALVSTPAGLLFLGGEGVDANAMFDADIALAICAGLLLDHLRNNVWSAASAVAYLVPLLLLLRTVDGDWTSAGYWLHPMAEETTVSAEEIALLRVSHEPVLCEMLSLCFWAGKSAQVDVFNTDQSIRTGAQPAGDLARLIEARRFSIIQLESLHPFPLPSAVEQATLRNYKIIRTDGERVFFAPR
jgi:hypothetical protein